jgi:glycosyltransferase involved in cell wall biosynthesis
MKKKILFLTGSLELGGIERLTKDLSIALKQTGEWDPGVCCLIRREGQFISDLEREGIPVYECRLEHNNMFSFPVRLSHIICNFSPDLVHSHVDFSIPWQIFGARIGGVKKIVFTQHNEYQNWEGHFWSRIRIFFYFWISWPFISAYTAVSRSVQHSVANLARRDDSDFLVINNPVDVTTFQPNLEKRAIARSAMGVGDYQFVIGNVARFAEQKGHSYLVQAAQIITPLMPECHFVLIGDGPTRELINTQVIEAGLENYFTFLGRRTNIQTLLLGFDVFVLPSVREGFPISLIEAMSCGLPVVASNIGGIVEAVGDEKGSLFPPTDYHALAEVLLKLQSQPLLAKALGQESRMRILNNYSMDAILSQYLQLYKRILRI